MDRDEHFSLTSDEFVALIGPHTASALGRKWHELADQFSLDPDGRMAAALAGRNTWSGVTLLWPVDGGGRLAVELSERDE